MLEEFVSKGSLLIIEDDESSRTNLRLIFEKKGFDIMTAETGREGLEKAQGKFFNVAILDIKLPDMEGTDLVQPLKEKHPDMALIVITGHASVDTAIKALNEGASAYVTKPLDMDDILGRVREFIEKQHLALENRRLYQEAQREILERQQAVKALRESEELFRLALGNSPITVFRQDRDLRFTWVYNPSPPFDPNSLLGKTDAELQPPDQAAALMGLKRRVLATGESSRDEFSFSAGGETLSCDVQVTPDRDESGEIIGVVCVSFDITKRKRAEEELQTSKRLLETVFDTIPFPVFVKNREGRTIMINKANADSIGLDTNTIHNEVTGEVPFGTKAEIARANGQDRMVVETGERVEIQEQLNNPPDGEEKLWHLIKVPLRGESGEIEGIVGMRWDITERTRAEEALRKSEEKYRLLVQGSLQGIFIHVGGKIVFCNHAFGKMFGYLPEDLLGQDVFKMLVAPADRDRVRANYRSRIQGKPAPERYEWQGTRKTGDNIHIEVLATLVDWEGETGALGTVIDITDRKRAEEERLKSEASLKQAQRIARMGSWESDLVTHSVIWSPEMYKIFGVDPSISPLTESMVEEFVHEEDRPNVTQAFSDATQGKLTPMEYRIVHQDGTVRSVYGEAVLINDEAGDPAYMVGIVQDITERKALEAQYQQAQKMKAVGTLAGGIAHNFNNLLQVIMGNISLLLRETDSGHPQHGILSEIKSMVNSGSKLTRQLMGFARGGKYEVKPTDLNALLLHTSYFVGSTHLDISVQKELDAELWTAKVDQNQIEQVLLNLFVNSQEAMPQGGKIIVQSVNVTVDDSFAKLHEATSGRYVKVSVQDTGTGMEPETLARIFEPFFTTKEVSDGSGLGLASVYGIVKNHKGIITVESEIGRGTTFDIYLPASEEEVERIKGLPKVEKRKGTGTILFVDDEEGSVFNGQRGLGMLGFDALVASSGMEAIEVYERNSGKIDLVVLDLTMPGMGGGEVFDKLRELNPKVKVLLSSGYSIDGQAGEIMERGCDGFIQKPFDLDTLSEKIHEILDRK